MNPAVQFITRTGVLLAMPSPCNYETAATGDRTVGKRHTVAGSHLCWVSSGIIIGLFTPLVAFLWYTGASSGAVDPVIWQPTRFGGGFCGVGKYYNKYLAAVVAAVAKCPTFMYRLIMYWFSGITLPPALVAAFGTAVNHCACRRFVAA